MIFLCKQKLGYIREVIFEQANETLFTLDFASGLTYIFLDYVLTFEC
mgnify:CR=1